MAKKQMAAEQPRKMASGFQVKLDRLFAQGHQPLAVFSASNENFAVHDIEVLQSKKGPFVQMPQTSYKSGRQTVYKDIFHPITAEARHELYGAIMELYEQARAEEAMKDEEESDAEELPEQGPSM